MRARPESKAKDVRMLFLTRRLGESLLIGDDIRLKIIDVREDRVRIGIEAPKAVPVVRLDSQSRPSSPTA